jgi:NAD(P)-dependent dehydrogenase (short-subunit alcohol dehydrogenase family)
VVLAGRRVALLEELAEECAGDALPVPADIRRPDDCVALVQRAVEWLGGLDALAYCPGIVTLKELSDATAEEWTASFETNVLGAVMCTRAALPHLKATSGHAIYLSSNSADKVPPWVGLGVYVATKLALESTVRTWQDENPEVAFSNFKVGPTAGEHRELADGAERIGKLWLERGHITGRQLQGEDHAQLIAAILTNPGRVESITVVPR